MIDFRIFMSIFGMNKVFYKFRPGTVWDKNLKYELDFPLS